jgi:pilus assembly protein CpaE
MQIVFFTADGWQFADPSGLPANAVSKVTGTVKDLIKVANTRPDLILIGGFEASESFLDKVKDLCEAIPQAVIVVHTKKSDADFLMTAMRDGVREVITMNTSEEIDGVIARAKLHLKGQNLETGTTQSQKIGFISAKGGDGGTCALANIATALAKDEKNRVVVVDLSLRYGDIEIYLTNKSVANNLMHFSTAVDRLDGTLLELMSHHVTDNLHLIPSPLTLEDILKIKIENIEKLVDILAKHYDYVLLDVGTGLDPVSIRIWDKLDKLVIVSSMTIPSARRASQILRLWEGMGLPAKKANILISRAGGPSDLSADDYEKAVGKKIWRTIYREFMGIQQSLLKGIPVVDIKPNSKFTDAVMDLADEWNGKPIKRKFSLWAFLGIK